MVTLEVRWVLLVSNSNKKVKSACGTMSLNDQILLYIAIIYLILKLSCALIGRYIVL